MGCIYSLYISKTCEIAYIFSIYIYLSMNAPSVQDYLMILYGFVLMLSSVLPSKIKVRKKKPSLCPRYLQLQGRYNDASTLSPLQNGGGIVQICATKSRRGRSGRSWACRRSSRILPGRRRRRCWRRCERRTPRWNGRAPCPASRRWPGPPCRPRREWR